MEAAPRLVPVREPAAPAGVAIVLHGGAARGDRVVVSPTQLSVLRMVPTARAVARAGRGRLAVYRLLNRYRGWDTRHTPVADADWALSVLDERFPGVPVGLVGHSLGGRAALLAGDAPAVRAVVALNPWVYPTDDADLSGTRVLVVHGLRDRVASAARAEAVVLNLSHTAHVVFETLPEGAHAMVRHGREFDRRAADFTAEVLLGGYRSAMTKEFKKGDRVEWDSHGGTAVGEVLKKITSRTEAGGRTVAASKEEPQYLVRSEKSGGEAVHKPEALRRRS